MAKKKRDLTAVCIFVGVLVVLFGAGWFFVGGKITAWWNYRAAVQTFGSAANRYHEEAAEIIEECGGEESAPLEPSRAGKAIFIRCRKVPLLHSRVEYESELDWNTAYLRSDLRASSTEDVQTVVLIYSRNMRVGTYVFTDETGGVTTDRKAYVEALDVKIVDVRNRRYLGRREFETRPKQSIGWFESGLAKHDAAEFVTWYEALPEY